MLSLWEYDVNMKETRHTPAGAAATELIVELFRLNGRLLAEGDRLVAPLGMSSARWQVLGAIALSPAPETVARLARTMGLTRQGVQRIVNELVEQGLVALRPNPHHRRASLVVLTPEGEAAYAQATALQIPWINTLTRRLPVAEIAGALALLRSLRLRLENATHAAGADPAEVSNERSGHASMVPAAAGRPEGGSRTHEPFAAVRPNMPR
jgi:DNA-binding MarR family transcriptional regulator